MRKWLRNMPRWLIVVLAILSILLGLRGAYNVGGIESVLWSLALAAPGVACVIGIYLFFRQKLKVDR